MRILLRKLFIQKLGQLEDCQLHAYSVQNQAIITGLYLFSKSKCHIDIGAQHNVYTTRTSRQTHTPPHPTSRQAARSRLGAQTDNPSRCLSRHHQQCFAFRLDRYGRIEECRGNFWRGSKLPDRSNLELEGFAFHCILATRIASSSWYRSMHPSFNVKQSRSSASVTPFPESSLVVTSTVMVAKFVFCS